MRNAKMCHAETIDRYLLPGDPQKWLATGVDWLSIKDRQWSLPTPIG
jgi:hypothetical protein